MIGSGADNQRNVPLLSCTCGTKKYWPEDSVSGLIEKLNSTSCPVTGPSPPVNWFGKRLIPLTTEFAAVKLGLSTRDVKLKVEEPELRMSNAVSEGELVRVGTVPFGGLVESSGKTR